MSLHNFQNWMRSNTDLSENSIYKYTRAFNTISREMLAINFLKKELTNMDLVELDFAIATILSHPQFIDKNTRGNNMYSSALKRYRLFAYDTFESLDTVEKIANSIEISNIETTEKEAIIKSRVGQGQYRKNILLKYKNRCVVTGIDHKKLLIASHIKPWTICKNNERIDTENGILLCANMDKLFDSGLITFSNAGKIFISSFLSNENRQRLNIDYQTEVDLKASTRMLHYLEFHRDVLFVK